MRESTWRHDMSTDTMSDVRTIEAHFEGAVGSIRLNRPEKLNPLGTTTLLELITAARWFDDHPTVKVVVVSGNGRAFSAGADLAAFTGPVDAEPGAGDPTGALAGSGVGAGARDAADAGRRMADAIEAMRAVTVVRLHGHCVGGALVLAAACDLRVAADTTRFSIPEVDLGIPLAWGGIPRLVREIGPAMTKELVMTCRTFGTGEAKAAGFLNRVVPEDRLDDEVGALVAQLSTKSSMTLAATKRHVNAVSEGMAATARSWSDADGLVAALHDPESIESAVAYLSRVR